jgi:hypothetical protein
MREEAGPRPEPIKRDLMIEDIARQIGRLCASGFAAEYGGGLLDEA